MTSKCREVLTLLDAIADAVDSGGSAVTLSGQAVGNAFYGLQGMDSDYVQVRRVLVALTRRMGGSTAMLSQGGGYSYKYNFSDSGPRSEQVGAEDGSAVMNGQNIGTYDIRKVPSVSNASLCSGNALWGLRNMTSDPPEVRAALLVLSRKIRESRLEMNGQNIGKHPTRRCCRRPSNSRLCAFRERPLLPAPHELLPQRYACVIITPILILTVLEQRCKSCWRRWH